MKKCLISIFIIFGCSFGISPANALSLQPLDACSSCGVTVGASCNSSSSGNIASGFSCAFESACEGGTCTYVSCNNKCYCARSSFVCSGGGDIIIDEDPTCSNTPTWGAINTTTGVQTGTCTISGKITTIYRCADGFYSGVISLGNKDYSTTSPMCTACPKHADDTSGTSGKPSYVTTNGAGVSSLITNCNIQANSEIQGNVGKFVFESGCSYRN